MNAEEQEEATRKDGIIVSYERGIAEEVRGFFLSPSPDTARTILSQCAEYLGLSQGLTRAPQEEFVSKLRSNLEGYIRGTYSLEDLRAGILPEFQRTS